MSLRMVDVSASQVPPSIGRMLPRNLAERHLVVPIALEDDRLVAAFADPTNVIALDDLKLYTGVTDIEVVVAVEGQVRDAIANAWAMSSDSAAMESMLDEFDDCAGRRPDRRLRRRLSDSQARRRDRRRRGPQPRQ